MAGSERERVGGRAEILPRSTSRHPVIPSSHPNTHQTRHAFGFTIACPALHPNAFANSGRSETMPFTRYLPGECGLVMAFTRRFSGRWFSQAHCAKPMKKRWSGVKPSTDGRFWFAVASFQAM